MKLGTTVAAAMAAIAAFCLPVAAAGNEAPLAEKGSSELGRGNYSQAINYLSAALRQNPSDIEARRHLSAALIGAGMPQQAVQQLEAIVRVAPGDSRDYVMMADAATQMGDSRTAVQHYKAAMQVNPTSTAARIGLARTYIAEGDLRSASSICNETLKLSHDAQTRRQFIELLSAIRMRASVVQKHMNG